MAEHSEETLELLERRLADRVTERVRPALFRLYTVAGSAVITALGLFGQSINADIKDRAHSRAEQSVQQAISPLITTATEKIRDSSTKIDAQLAVMEWLGQRARVLTKRRTFSRALVKKGYIVPGEDREPGAAGKREVRYFYPEDKPLATRLATDAVDALQELGYNPPPQVAVKSLVEYEGKKSRPGMLELWLELPAR